MTSTSERLRSSTDGRARFASVDVVLPAEWRDTECVDGIDITNDNDVAYAEGFDGADFVAGPGSSPLGRGGIAAAVEGQFGGCGVPAEGGVAIPAALLVRDANVTRQDGEYCLRTYSSTFGLTFYD